MTTERALNPQVVVVTGERRELYVGLPTVVAIGGNKLAPGLADHYLAWSGYESQQTGEPVAPDRVDNLWSPVPGDHGAHGAFGDRARARSWQLWATTHRGWLALAATGIATAAAVFLTRGHETPRPVRRVA